MLRVEGISKRFGGLRAVDAVSFELKAGEILGLIGPNGAGKTTLFNLISGFMKAESGSAVFKGKDLIGLRPHEICRLGITRTFQIVQPFKHLSIFENVLIGALNKLDSYEKAVARANEIIDFIGFSKARKRYGMDLNIVESKRLEIAKALSTDPELLLIDEIMAGLNLTELEQMIELLVKLNQKNITLFIVEHNMRAIIAVTSRIIVLNYGEKICEGPPEKVLHDPAVVDAYLGGEPDAQG